MEFPNIPFSLMFIIKGDAALRFFPFYFLLIAILQRFIPQACEKHKGA
jgi:hypothetical protein